MIFSGLLVAGQIILIAQLASPVGQLYSGSALDIMGLLLVTVSILVAIWAFLSMRSGTFTVMPEPTAGASLTETGPYAYVRHPMYTAVILGGLGAALCHGDLRHWLLLAALVSLLLIKLMREERYLLDRYDTYNSYKARTHVLFPFVY